MATTARLDVVCPGTPWEMGHAQGLALRSQIFAARDALRRLEAFRLRQPWWLPYPLYRVLASHKAWRSLRDPLERDLPDQRQRLEGLAAGAGLPLKTAYLLNVLEPLLSSVGHCTACPGACSAVAVRGSRSATGEPIIARNFDYLPLAQPFYALRDSQPRDGRRALEFVAAPLVGTLDGLNDAGLAITYNYAFTTDAAQPAAPVSMRIAEALRRCRTVDQAADAIGAGRHWGSGLLMLADATGDIASLELSNTRFALRRPAPGEDALFHTNTFVTPKMREVQIPDDAVYTATAPLPLRGRRLHLSSELRNDRFQHLLNARERFGPDELQALMADHGPDGTPGDFTPCVHGTYWYTTACLQLFPRSRRLRVAYSTACQARFTELAL